VGAALYVRRMPIARRLRRTLLLTLAAIAAVPGTALATTPPTILTAGIDAQDRLYATWSLAPGTTYEQVEFATMPAADDLLPEFFVDDQFADYDSCDLPACASRTSYTSEEPIKRDRRYFVKVTAEQDDESAASAVWVIDETKPLVPGNAKSGDGKSNSPVAGKPFDGTGLFPPGVVPSASIKVLKAPKTIRGLVSQGVRVRVTSSVAYAAETVMYARGGNGGILGLRAIASATPGTRTFSATVDAKGRASLRRRARERIRLEVVVILPDGTRKKTTRFFTVRR
jgi:hypothetical protein